MRRKSSKTFHGLDSWVLEASRIVKTLDEFPDGYLLE